MAPSLVARSANGRRVEVVHGPTSPLLSVLRTCSRIAASNATVLITGETGTGKEVFARYIHERSERADKPLVAVNCAAIPETLLESELFGYVRGAFTGATAPRRGRVALAEGGTLFLDEVGELPLALQVKLLRLLQERVYEPLGSAESISADFRLIAATNRDLAAEVEAGRFRRDLYYRLMVCPFELPPLRARRGDVAALMQHFWTQRGEQRPIDAAVFAQLERYNWPGNVRELENLVERLSVCAEGARIALADLPAPFRPEAPDGPLAGESVAPPTPIAVALPEAAPALAAPAGQPPQDGAGEGSPDASAASPLHLVGEAPEELLNAPPTLPVDLPELLRRIEESYINRALELAEGNKSAAAAMLGLQRTTLVEKLRRRNRDASAA